MLPKTKMRVSRSVYAHSSRKGLTRPSKGLNFSYSLAHVKKDKLEVTQSVYQTQILNTSNELHLVYSLATLIFNQNGHNVFQIVRIVVYFIKVLLLKIGVIHRFK